MSDPSTLQEHQRWRARAMIIIASALLLVVAILLIASSASRSMERAATGEFRRQGLVLAKVAANGIESYVHTITTALHALATDSDMLRMSEDAVRYQLKLKAQELEHSGVRDVGVIDAKGVLRFSGMDRRMEGADFSARRYFQEGKGAASSDSQVIQFIDMEGVEPPGGLLVGVPMFRPLPDGEALEFVGIVMCVVDFTFLADGFIQPVRQTPRGRTFFLDGDGIVLSAADRSLIGRDVLTGCDDLDAFRDVVQRMKNGEAGTAEYLHYSHDDETGEYAADLEEMLIAFAPVRVGGRPWSIGVWAPTADAMGDIRAARRLQHVVVGLSVLIVLAGAAGAVTVCARLRGMLKREVDLKTAELRHKQVEIDASHRELADATDKVSELFETAGREQVLGNYFENPNMAACWKVRECSNSWCPCHGKEGVRCWQVEGTYCDNERATPFAEKVLTCGSCEVYRQSCPDRLTELAEGFNNVMYLLHRKVEETRQLRYHALQRERMATIGQMAAGIAHEIDNPMASLFSLVQLLKRANPDEESEARLGLMQQCIERISKTVREVVDFGRPIGHEDWAEGDVVKCIEDTVKLLCYDRRARNVEVSMDFEPDLPKTLIIEHQLQQVFMNILVNALDAMGGRGSLKVRGRRVADMIEVTISDTGEGMRPEQIQHIFEPFYTTKAGQKGTGLGLALSYGTMQRHGGAIHVESEVGKGSIFVITVPLRSPDGDSNAPRQDPGR